MRKFQSLLFVLKRSYICYHINCVRPATLLKKRLWRRCFPVNFEKFLRAIFSQNISGRLILHNNDLNFSTWVFFYGCWFLYLIRFCQWIITNDMVNDVTLSTQNIFNAITANTQISGKFQKLQNSCVFSDQLYLNH